MNIPKSKSSTSIPSYTSGKIELYEENQTRGDYPLDYLKPLFVAIWYNEISIGDKLKFEFETRSNHEVRKIRIQQIPNIDSRYVVKLNEVYYRIFNIFHGSDKNGFAISDITLTYYPNPILEV
ncbi:hypothetical protein [Erysipelothrix anatis]|uniref:hypothetical protein n=1 Tax=Erysipelothrix anatis TaxID=2683713 RepID=UPI00135ADAE8|nr:hypothetical protein [Erysipelothrix anatis]